MEVLPLEISCQITNERTFELFRGLEEVARLPPFINPISARKIQVSGGFGTEMVYTVSDIFRDEKSRSVVRSEYKRFTYTFDDGLKELDLAEFSQSISDS